MWECVRLVDQLSMFAGVRVTSPSSVAEGLSDDASVKKAGQRGTKTATAPRVLSDRTGKVMLIIFMRWSSFVQCMCICMGLSVT